MTRSIITAHITALVFFITAHFVSAVLDSVPTVPFYVQLMMLLLFVAAMTFKWQIFFIGYHLCFLTVFVAMFSFSNCETVPHMIWLAHVGTIGITMVYRRRGWFFIIPSALLFIWTASTFNTWSVALLHIGVSIVAYLGTAYVRSKCIENHKLRGQLYQRERVAEACYVTEKQRGAA